MDILLLQIKPQIGNLKNNFQIIQHYYIRSLELGLDLCVLPELFTTGYIPGDLLLRSSFIKDLEYQIQQLLPITSSTTLLLPSPMIIRKKLYNGVYALQNGKIIAKTTKFHLPNYGIFDERRYFEQGQASIIKINRNIIGVLICEDMWFDDVVNKLKNDGAQLLIVINASPYWKGKPQQRLEIIKDRFDQTKLPIIYCNQVLGHDGIIYDGGSMVYDGVTNHTFNHCQEDIVKISVNTTTAIIDKVDKIQSFHPYITFRPTCIEEELYQAIILGLKDYMQDNEFTTILLGLSGGIDSALSCHIAADAVGAKNVYAVMMPFYGITSNESIEDATNLAHSLNVNYKIISINEAVDSILNQVNITFNITHQNLQSRARGLTLMTIANDDNHLLLTTGNKSELAVGYTTIYGDMCGGFNLIKDLYKTDVMNLAKFLKIPQNIISKEPSPELSTNQKDSDNLPKYEILDKILYMYIEQNLGFNDIIRRGFKKSEVELVLKLVKSAEFKRKQSALGIKLSSRDLDKDWRYPITCN
ncbi:MAG: NAD+ synthase [Rickettsiaceae bacterium]